MNFIARLFDPLYRWLTAYMGRQGLILYGIFDCDCACAAPPDYSPVANASREAAEVMAQLGREQIAEARRQYDTNLQVSRSVVDAQVRNMNQAYEQGNYSFENFRNEGRPLQQAMRGIAMGQLSSEVAAQAEQGARAGVADVAGALDAQRAQSTRNMQRMGINPNSGRMAAMNGIMDIGAATAKASAANAGRNQAIDRSYARMGDVLNTYSGMASSAPTFYQTGTQSGNSAMGNQMAPGNSFLSAVQGGIGAIGQGQQMRIGGLSNVLNAQTSFANSMNQTMSSGSDPGGLGSLLGGAASLYTAFGSDRRLKDGIVAVGRDERTGLTLYEFTYISDPDKRRYVGVMADEVRQVMPEAVVTGPDGFDAVNYGMLGIEMKEVA